MTAAASRAWWLRRAPATPATRRFVVLGLASVVAVCVGCLLSGPAEPGRQWLLIALLSGATLAWACALLVRPADWRVASACYLTCGLAGCGADLLQPRGPAFVLGYMALAGVGLTLPRGPAITAGAIGLVGLGGAEAVTSDHPGSAVTAVTLGAGFLFVAAQFAAMSRDAQRRSAELLARVQGERAAQEEAAVLAERSRVARELHDVLAHTLSGLSLQLEASRMLAVRSGADPALVGQLTVAHKLARQGMAGAKQAIATLRGSAMPGLADLPVLVAEFRRSTGLPVRLETVGTPLELGAAQQLAAYRAVQEALSNVAKHEPEAGDVPVRIEWSERALHVSVNNTRAPGSETCATPVGEPGFGLTGMAERAAMLGGSVASGPTEDGFAVRWELPIDGAQVRPGPRAPTPHQTAGAFPPPRRTGWGR